MSAELTREVTVVTRACLQGFGEEMRIGLPRTRESSHGFCEIDSCPLIFEGVRYDPPAAHLRTGPQFPGVICLRCTRGSIPSLPIAYTLHRYNTTVHRKHKDDIWFMAEYELSEPLLKPLPQNIRRTRPAPRRLIQSVKDDGIEHFRREQLESLHVL
jgi:hypothetical protein